MYISCLLVDTGVNPDRPRPGRVWLHDAYSVHRRLCMAFPNTSRKSRDSDFLAPFTARDFGLDQVHARRQPGCGMLYRIDTLPGAGAVVLVQSAVAPDWNYAFRNSSELLAAPPQVKPYSLHFASGQVWRFKLLANISKRSQQYRRRVALTWEKGTDPLLAVRAWLERKCQISPAEGAQREVTVSITGLELVKMGWVHGYKPHINKDGSHPVPGVSYTVQHDMLRFRSALLEGVLRVENADAFTHLVAKGIGSGKAFGFGLLSLARMP